MGDRGDAGVGGQVPEDLNADASPISKRIRAAVLTPIPGIEVRTPARGCSQPRPRPACVAGARFQAVHEPGQHGVRRRGARGDNGLLVQRGQGRGDQLVTHAGCVRGGDRGERAPASGADAAWATTTRQDLRHGRMADPGADGAFECGMDAGEQAADAVADAGWLRRPGRRRTRPGHPVRPGRPCRRPGRGTSRNRWSSVMPFVRRGWSHPHCDETYPVGGRVPNERSLDAHQAR